MSHHFLVRAEIRERYSVEELVDALVCWGVESEESRCLTDWLLSRGVDVRDAVCAVETLSDALEAKGV